MIRMVSSIVWGLCLLLTNAYGNPDSLLIDGFETGDFSALAWEHPDTPWQVIDTDAHSGTYSARSGVVAGEESSTLSLTCQCRSGEIHFKIKVFSEDNQNGLIFGIDGNEVAAWSGELAWTQVSFPITAGEHTFTWSQHSKSVGWNAAWLDDVALPGSSDPTGIVFMDIPAGSFEMGDHYDVGGSDEQPVHMVTLDPFRMSKYETTNAQYAMYLNAALAEDRIHVVNGVVYAVTDLNRDEPYCDMYSSDPESQIEYSQGEFTIRHREGYNMADHPMLEVSWYGAQAFCDYYGYRLPTEAEWEYAARGGFHDPYYQYPWGSNEIDCTKMNNWQGSPCNPLNFTEWAYTAPVGYYGAQGAYGLCDMSGNAWEWCADWHAPDYYSTGPVQNPRGPSEGFRRVLRGGTWIFGDMTCRVAARYKNNPTYRDDIVGFRVCLRAPASD